MNYAPAPGVVATDLGDEVILLAPASGEMFSLNATGRCVWFALERGLDAAVDALVERYDVSRERAGEEAAALLDALLAAGLVVPTDA